MTGARQTMPSGAPQAVLRRTGGDRDPRRPPAVVGSGRHDSEANPLTEGRAGVDPEQVIDAILTLKFRHRELQLRHEELDALLVGRGTTDGPGSGPGSADKRALYDKLARSGRRERLEADLGLDPGAPEEYRARVDSEQREMLDIRWGILRDQELLEAGAPLLSEHEEGIAEALAALPAPRQEVVVGEAYLIRRSLRPQPTSRHPRLPGLRGPKGRF